MENVKQNTRTNPIRMLSFGCAQTHVCVFGPEGWWGHGQPCWRPSLAKLTLASVSVLVVWPTLAKTDFDLWCCVLCGVWCVVCVCVAWVLVSRFWFGHVRCSRELQTCTFERPGASNTTKIQRKDPRRITKRAKMVAGDGKKSAKFWAPPFSPHFIWVAPTLLAPYFPSNPHFLGPWGPPSHPTHTHTQKKPEQLISKNPNN